MQQRQILVGRNHIDAVGGQRHAIAGLHHRHRGHPLQQLGQRTAVAGVKMLDDDEGHAARRRHMAEKGFECLETAGRTTDADNGKTGTGQRRHNCRRRGGERVDGRRPDCFVHAYFRPHLLMPHLTLNQPQTPGHSPSTAHFPAFPAVDRCIVTILPCRLCATTHIRASPTRLSCISSWSRPAPALSGFALPRRQLAAALRTRRSKIETRIRGGRDDPA